MAQLRYTKVVACGTVAAAAGIGLVGIYFYKRRAAAKKTAQKKATTAKALVAEDKQNRNKTGDGEQADACIDCRKDEGEGANVGSNNYKMRQNENTPVEEPCIQQQVAMTTSDIPPPHTPIVIEEELCMMATSVSTTESVPPLLRSEEEISGMSVEEPCITPANETHNVTGDSGMIVEEPCVQSIDASSTKTMMMNGYGDAGVTNGNETSSGVMNGVSDGLESPFMIDGQAPPSFDWASSVDAAEKTVESPTSSTHNGSVAESDLGSEGNSEGSSFDSGRCSGGSTTSTKETVSAILPDVTLRYLLEFPSKFCGKLIGKQGRNIRQLKDTSKASVQLKEHPYLEETHLVVVEGLQSEIDVALKYIKDRFTKVDVTKQYTPPAVEPSPTLEMSQLPLPEDIVNDVYLSSVVSGAHVFVQQPTHPTFMALQRLDSCMAQTYNLQADTVPLLPRPIESGVICAAPMMQGWYRAQVVEIYPDTDECDIKFLDYGGYGRIEAGALKQIRSDFMSLPFQAVECYLINLLPLPGEAEYSETSRLFIEHIAQNFNMLHAKVKGYGQDGIPLVELYYTDSERNVQSLNKELVNQGHVSWYEGYSDEDLSQLEAVSESCPPQDNAVDNAVDNGAPEPTDGTHKQV